MVGLCIGFSFLSGAEFIYFFTIRLLFDKIRKNKSIVVTAVDNDVVVDKEETEVGENAVGKNEAELFQEVATAGIALDKRCSELLRRSPKQPFL